MEKTASSVTITDTGKRDTQIKKEEEEEESETKTSFWSLLRNLRDCGRCCWIFCCPPCPCECIRKAAFQPPKRSYFFKSEEKPQETIKKPTADTKHLFPLRIGFEPTRLLRFMFDFPATNKGKKEFHGFLQQQANMLKDAECFFIRTSRGSWISCLFQPCPLKPAKSTIFFSHSNAADLGIVALYRFLESSLFWQSNIFTYDFSGYGMSTGCCREKNLYADTQAAYKALVDRYKLVPGDVILMGRSLGTAAVIDLASKESEVGGVVLLSPFESALRVVSKTAGNLNCMEKFRSFEKISQIKSPVLVIHGRKDRIVAFSHGEALYNKCFNPVEPLWLDWGDHNDLEFFPEYWIRIRDFISKDLGRGPICADILEAFSEAVLSAWGITDIHPQCAISVLCYVCQRNYAKMRERSKARGPYEFDLPDYSNPVLHANLRCKFGTTTALVSGIKNLPNDPEVYKILCEWYVATREKSKKESGEKRGEESLDTTLDEKLKENGQTCEESKKKSEKNGGGENFDTKEEEKSKKSIGQTSTESETSASSSHASSTDSDASTQNPIHSTNNMMIEKF